MKPDFSVSGKVFIITGGSGILCAEMARELSDLGARIAILNRTLSKAQALAQELVEKGGDAIGLACDVTDKDSLLRAREAVLARWSRVDVLINGAGGNRPEATTSAERSFFQLSETALREVFDLNLLGTVLPSQVFGETMAAQGKGCILNIASMGGIRPLTNVAGYGSAKAAVVNFTQWLASWFCLNVSKHIRVNAIAPGFLLTDQNRYLLTDKNSGEPTARGRHILAQTPMNRYGEPHELVGAVVYLCSDAASFVTGTVITVDGGFSVYSI